MTPHPDVDIVTFLLDMKSDLRSDIRSLDLKLDQHIEDHQTLDSRLDRVESKVKLVERAGMSVVGAAFVSIWAYFFPSR